MNTANDTPDSLEDISAGLLNGMVVTLLGSAIAGVIIWQIIAQFTGWLPDLEAISAGVPAADFKTLAPSDRQSVIQQSVGGVVIALMSLGFVRRGARHVRKHLTLLRRRRK